MYTRDSRNSHVWNKFSIMRLMENWLTQKLYDLKAGKIWRNNFCTKFFSSSLFFLIEPYIFFHDKSKEY